MSSCTITKAAYGVSGSLFVFATAFAANQAGFVTDKATLNIAIGAFIVLLFWWFIGLLVLNKK
jgi:hypothetical protein